MRKTQLLSTGLLALAMVFHACKKDDSSESKSVPTPSPVGAVPSSFSKKVLLEEFTGEWCVNCPSGADYVHTIVTKYPGKAIAVGVHQGDWLEIGQLTFLEGHLGGIAGYPRAAINRVPAQNTGSAGQDGYIVYSRGSWETNTDRLIDQGAAKTGKSGLAIESTLKGTKLNVKVHCGFSATENRDTRLTVYIIQNGVVAQSQTGATTNPYIHEHVLRKVVSSASGDAVSMKSGNEVVKEYNDIDLSGYVLSDVEVVAFINVVGSSSTQHEVLNVQSVKAGQIKKWD